MAVITLAFFASTARAQSMDVGAKSSVVDWSLNPGSDGANDPHSATGLATNSFLYAQASTTFGNGAATAKAAGKAGVMQAYSSTSYNYVIRAADAGGYAESGASVDFTDLFTVTSSTLAAGTLTTLNFAYIVDGSVNAPYADQLRPGISAFADGYIRAQTQEDDQEASFSFPEKPLSNMGITVQAAVGETFQLRYGLETGTYLQSDIPDYRFVDSDFYNTVHIYADATDPNVSFTTASGYSYAFPAVVPESNTVLLFLPGFVCLMGALLWRQGRCFNRLVVIQNRLRRA